MHYFVIFLSLQEMRESLAIAQNELSCLKANPSGSVGRGNSLFAEVEDKRQSMLKKCSSLSKKYHEMKTDYSSKCSEISRLRVLHINFGIISFALCTYNLLHSILNIVLSSLKI